MRKVIICVICAICGCFSTSAQTDIKWKAQWICVPGAPQHDFGVYHFAKDITLKEVPQQFIVHCSADNRYKLYVNGTLVSCGPALSDLGHWNYETIDLAPWLKAGDNRLSATVWNDGPRRAAHQLSSRTAFMLQGHGDAEKAVNTGASWLCREDKSYNQMPDIANVATYLQPGEIVDMNRRTDDSWTKAEVIGVAQPLVMTGVKVSVSQWELVESGIPQMERRNEQPAVGATFPLTVKPNSVREFLLDQTYLTNAYPLLTFSGGQNATISLTYAESLYESGTKKGNRNETAGKQMRGRKDSIISNGSPRQQYEPLDWRTFRYVKIAVRTADQPLTLDGFSATFTGYPFENNSTFEASDPSLKKMLEIGWRTARLCAGETYFDCPYYEQMQYGGDTRLQALISYYNSGDDRLARRAITLLDYSRTNEGLVLGRYPSQDKNLITPYALSWIGMLYDFYRYRDDAEFLRPHLRGMRQVLDFFSDYEGEDGSLVRLPYWLFTDWVVGGSRSWRMGAPRGDANGTSSVIDLQHLAALQYAAELERALGLTALADIYAEKAERLMTTVRSKYLNSERSLFADDPSQKAFSQHANILAILTGVTQGDEARDIFTRILNPEDDITRCSLYFQYYLFQAMKRVGMGDAYLDLLSVWRDYMSLGMTTWGETSDVENTRSDCHAWSASPNIEMFRTVLGIDADAPGFSSVVIAPCLGQLTKASGSIPHPKGKISVSYQKDKKGTWRMDISLPQGVKGRLIWKNQEINLQNEQEHFTFSNAVGNVR